MLATLPLNVKSIAVVGREVIARVVSKIVNIWKNKSWNVQNIRVAAGQGLIVVVPKLILITPKTRRLHVRNIPVVLGQEVHVSVQVQRTIRVVL